jgi:hypothetical protein
MPSSFSVQYFITQPLSDGTFLPINGEYTITLHLIGDNPDTPLLSQEYTKSVREGLLTLDIEVTDPSIFTNNQLKTKLLITNLSANAAIEQLNTTQTSDTAPPTTDEITVSLYAKTHTKVSYSSNYTQNFYNPRLLQIQYAPVQDDSTVSFNVTVGTTNATEKLTVDGTLNAHGFIGDGSGIENINLLRWTKGDETIEDETIYYIDGPVGMGTETPSPSASLHIASDTGTPTMQINQNIEIRNSLDSTFYGDVLNVSSFNATAFTTGTVTANRLIGSYPKITGLGTLTSGYWHGQMIDKAYIANDLTIENSAFTQPNLQGTLNISALFSLKNPVFPLTIQSQSSTLSDQPSLNSIVFSSTTLNGQDLTFKDPFYISNISNSLLSINTSGNISIGNISPLQALNVNGGMVINSSTTPELGIIRYTSGTGFSGYSFDGPTKKWKLFDKKIGNFTGHSLLPEYEASFDKYVLSIDAQGHIGIGMRPQNTQDISIAGNVVFLSSPNIPFSFTAPPSQDSLVWVASPGAFRVGRNLLSSPFGYGSVAIGVSTNATSTGSISINFGNTTTSGNYSVTLGSGNSDGMPLNNPFNNTTILASDTFGSNSPPSFLSDPIGNDSVVLSSFLSHISGTNNILISTFLDSPLVNNNSVMFGSTAASLTGNAIGDHSFIFLSNIHKNHLKPPTHTNYDHSFSIFGYTGINTNKTNSQPLSVNGIFYADNYIGLGNITNVNADQLYTMSGPVRSYKVVSPNSIYASDDLKILPTNIANSATITNNTIQSIDIKPYSIVSRNIAHNTLTKGHLADNSITNIHFKDNSLFGDVFSNITSKNFFLHVANHEKLATNSINTTHFTDQVIPDHYLPSDIINSTNMLVNNIALGGVHIQDLLPGELYNSMYFATANISGFHVTRNALLNRHITSNAIASLHIANHAIMSMHITDNAITSSNILDNAVVSRHFTTDDYVATQETLTNNVFIGRHFDDRVIKPRMFTQTSFKVAADQFATPAILSNDISSNAILSSHVSDDAINAGHVSSNAITSTHIKNSSLTSINFSASAITSSNILDQSLSHHDIAPAAIQGVHFIPGTITANHIASDAITNTHIGTKQISSQLLVANAIAARHISDRALTSSKFQKNAITSNNISVSTIASTNLQALVITSKNNEIIASNSINWSHITGPIPINRMPLLTASKLSLGAASITSKHIQENAITETKFALNFTISDADISKLQLPISVDQGGTGLTESDYKSDSILFLETKTNTTFSGYYFGQDAHFVWKNNRLLIASPNTSNLNPTSKDSMIVSGNVQSIGGVTITQDNTSSYNIGLHNDYLQFTSGNVTTGNDSHLLGIKAKKIYLKDALYVGTSGPCISNCSSVIVSGNVAIGSSFISKPAPSNGLLIEHSLQIENTDNKGILNVKKTILAESYTSSPIIVSDITNANPSIKTGLKSTSTPITSQGAITGMRIAGPIGGTVMIPKGSSTVTGIKLSVEQGTALIVSQNATVSHPTINAYLAHISNGTKYGVYGIAPDTTNAYAAYFNSGHIYAKNLAINVADAPPTATLRTSKLYHEDGPIKFHDKNVNNGSTIDWDQYPIAHITINSPGNRILQFTPPKHSTFLLLKIKYVSNGTGGITFPSTVRWSSNWTNNPTEPKIQSGEDVEHIIRFYFDKLSNTYYGSIGYNFK